jgi:hypothetical protein
LQHNTELPLYVVLYRPEALQDPMLFGTIVHALARHSRLVDGKEAANMLKERAYRGGTLPERRRLGTCTLGEDR